MREVVRRGFTVTGEKRVAAKRAGGGNRFCGKRIASPPFPDQESFVAALCKSDPVALRQLFIFYSPLLKNQARIMSVPEGERDELVFTLLDDIVLHLTGSEAPPRDITRYIVSALRNRARKWHRDVRRQQATEEAAYVNIGDSEQRIVAECHSAFGLETSNSADASSPPPAARAIRKLAIRSASELNEWELSMVVALSCHFPLRDIAEETGVEYGSARVRLHRLRERFTRFARQYARTLNGEKRKELDRFFRRAGVALESADHSPAHLPNAGTNAAASPNQNHRTADD